MSRRLLPCAPFFCFIAMGGTPPAIPSTAVNDSVSITAISHIKAFEEPLQPIGGVPTLAENKALWQALVAYQRGGSAESVVPIVSYLETYPGSSWNASLLLDLGLTYRRTGYFTHALDTLEKGWQLSKSDQTLEGRRVADRIVCELIELNSRLGRMDRLKELYAEIDHRPLVGPASERVASLRQGLWLMEHDPGISFRCGPMALQAYARAMGRRDTLDKLDACASTQDGTSLLQNLEWAKSLKLGLQAAKRTPGSEVIVPSVVHWKAGHFAAVVKAKNGRYLLQDPTFGEETWISRAAMDEEATGYALVPSGNLPHGWRSVDDKEAMSVRGKGTIGGMDPNGQNPNDPHPPSCPNPHGMPVYNFDLAYVALGFTDTPVGYQPPRGYPIQFQLSYSQQDTYQPQTFAYSNVGPLWTFGWMSYITDDPSNPGQNVTLYSTIGGRDVFTGFNATTQAFQPQYYTHGILQKTGAASYVITNTDGSKEVYAQSDGATTSPRKVFLTQRIDPAGNAQTYSYDAQLRLTTVMDALGQTTTLSYGLTTDPLKVTQVQDPFGRKAVLTYNAGQLASITDAMGMTTTFAYGPSAASPTAPANFINAMTTPYGTTTFTMGINGIYKWVVATDPLGNQERMEFGQSVPGYAPSGKFPAGFSDPYMYARNVFYWNKRAMSLYPGDYNKATVYHFLHSATNSGAMASVLELIYKPLENYECRTYPGQTNILVEGTGSDPASISRMLDDGSTQTRRYQYNSIGKITQEIDPAGRTTSYVYAPNGIDLLEVHNISGNQDDLLAKYTYNTQHRPLTVTDASGQTTTFTYNSFGQVHTVTNPKHETTTLTYDLNGYLQNIQGPVTGASTGFTYDGVGRIQSVTNSDGYTLSYTYDYLDRRIQVTYPDATTEQTIYSLLDVGRTKDRLNRWTLMTYNPIRQLTDVQDPQGRLTHLNWCGCGTLEGLVDPMGRITTWARDLEGRVVAKIYPDLTQTSYAYDSAGRLIQRTDAKGQVTSYGYFLDDDLKSVVYSNAGVSTPSASYTYDLRYNRLATSTGVLGTTVYTYNPVALSPILGATRLASVTSPMANSTIAYGYDELGRVLNRSINGVSENRTYDALGRISTVSNPLGSFTYTYDGATNRLMNVAYPNGQTTGFTYFDAAGDKRLKSIQNLKSTGANISTFGYTYDATGDIHSWTQQADAQSPRAYSFSYDPVGQLLGATLTDASTSQVLKTYAYGYDDAGNRTTEQINGAITTSTYNNLNQMEGQNFSATPSLAGPQGGESPAAVGAPKAWSGKSHRRLTPKKPLQPLTRN